MTAPVARPDGPVARPSAVPPHRAGRRPGIRPGVRSGAAAMLPLLAGYAPFAVLVGVTVANSSSPPAAWSGVWLVFAGSAHLAVIQLTDAGAGVAAAVAVSAVINLRLVVFSATIARYWRGTRVRSRLLAALTLIDPTWMLIRQRFDHRARPEEVREVYRGASLVLWVGWAALVTVGACAGNLVPPDVGLEVLAPLFLVAMVVPGARSAAGLACVVASAAVTVGTTWLPAGVSTLLAMPAGVSAALLARRYATRRTR